MARADTHSRVVAWLKIALPLAALAVLATLFLLADRIDPDDALPYAEVDVEDRARTPRMTAPTYAGVTSDGARTELTAASAQIDDEARQVVLSGGVEAATSAGYRIATEGITANLDRSGLESTGPVTAATPAGTLSADRFTLRPDAKAEGAYVLVFNGAVKLVYQPGGTGSP